MLFLLLIALLNYIYMERFVFFMCMHGFLFLVRHTKQCMHETSKVEPLVNSMKLGKMTISIRCLWERLNGNVIVILSRRKAIKRVLDRHDV